MDRFKKNTQSQFFLGSTKQFWKQAAGLVGIAIAYWITVRLGLLSVAHPEDVASIWPASGMALAVLLLNPQKQWTKLLLIIFVINMAGNWSGGNSLPISLGFALANILEALLAAWALTWICKSKITFERPVEIIALLGVATISNGFSALMGAAVPVLAFGAPFFSTWQVWWASDGLGIILVTPLIVTWVVDRSALRSMSARQLFEAVLLTTAVIVFSWLLFGPFTAAENPILRSYMLIPILFLLVFRYKLRGLTGVMALLAIIAIFNTLQGHGAFAYADQSITERIISIQLFLGVITFSGLFLGSILTELKQSEESLRESEDKFKYVFEYSIVGKSITLTSGEMNANKALCNMLGYTQAELQSKKWQEITHPDDIGLTQKEIDQLVSGAKNSTRFNKRFIHNNGSAVWVDLSSSLRRDKDGKPLYLISSVIDITEHMQAEEVRKESEHAKSELLEKLNEAQQVARVGSWEWNLQTDQIWWSNEMYRIFGVTPQNFVPSFEANRKFIHPEDFAIHDKAFEHSLQTGEPLNIELRMFSNNGLLKYCHAMGKIICDESGRQLRFIGTFMDNTERKQAEDAIKRSEKKYRELHESMMDGFVSVDMTGKFLGSNEIYRNMLGYSDAELAQLTYLDLTPEKWHEYESNILHNQIIKRGYSDVYEKEYRRKDGTVFPAELHTVLSRDENGNPVSMWGIVRDISERKQTEQTLRETSERLSHMIANSPTVIYALKVDGAQATPMWISQNIKAILGFSAEDGLQPEWWLNQVHPQDRPDAQASLEHLFDDFYQHEYRFLHKDGSLIWLHDEHRLLRDRENKPWEIVGAWTDITEHKQVEETLKEYNSRLEISVEKRTRELRDTQEQLVRQEKLAVLGQMAGSVGHELRNPLGVISNAVYFLKMVQPNSSDKVKEYLNIIETNVHISSKIVSDLLDFTRIKTVDRKPVSASELIYQTLKQFPAPAGVQVALDLFTDLPQVYVDPQHIVQVLGNLTLNACQAMMPQGGTLTISARIQGEMVGVSVRDTGSGISTENMKKLFEPLFTTKPKGIGLGLSVSKNLIEANSGRIEVQSEQAIGSTFTIFLPIHRSAS